MCNSARTFDPSRRGDQPLKRANQLRNWLTPRRLRSNDEAYSHAAGLHPDRWSKGNAGNGQHRRNRCGTKTLPRKHANILKSFSHFVLRVVAFRAKRCLADYLKLCMINYSCSGFFALTSSNGQIRILCPVMDRRRRRRAAGANGRADKRRDPPLHRQSTRWIPNLGRSLPLPAAAGQTKLKLQRMAPPMFAARCVRRASMALIGR